MLQTMRDNAQGMVAKVIVFFIIVVFALWGVESIVTLGGGEPAEATVGGNDISEIEITRVVEQQKNNLRRQFGDQYNEDLFNAQFLRQSALEQLINQKVSLVQADKLGLFASGSAIDQQIVSMPAFQLDGKFSKEQFQNILRMNGWSPLSFRADLGNDIKVNQAQAAFVLTSVETPFNVQVQEALNNESRSFRFIEVTAESQKDSVNLSEDDISAYYEDNKSSYKTEEKVSVSYVELKRSALAKQQEVSEEDLEIAYGDYVAKESEQEQRNSSHILIEVSDERDDVAALALAQEIQSKLAAGEEFEALAKEFSDDIGTKNVGGDLGLNTRGAFVPEFESALYALQKDEVSEPVKTEFGYHLIRLDDVVANEVASLDSMKAQLSDEIRNEKAAALFAEQQQELSNVSFSAGSMEEVADVMGTQVATTDFFTRAQGEGVATNSEIRKLAFQDNILLDREISSVVETADGALVFMVAKHEEPAVKPLVDVKEQIIAVLTSEKASASARAKAEEILANAKDVADWSAVTTTFANASDAPRAVQQKAFEIATGQSELVATPGGFSIVVVDGIDKKDWQDMQISDELFESGRTQQSRSDMVSYQGWSKENVEIIR